MTTATVSQGGLIVLGATTPSMEVSQGGLVVVAALQPDMVVTSAALVVIASGAPCSTRRCQLWSIERTDGVVLRFTSHDQAVTFGDETYEACASLNESAQEQTADNQDIGNVELDGLLSSDAISEEDLYAGRYNDAFVQVWRVSWDDGTDKIFRVAAGWIGNVSHGERGWKAEVLGPGARLLQQPLLQIVSPTCRWQFGDEDTCGIDAEALAIPGTVLLPSTRSYFGTDLTDPGGAAQWDRGKVRWTYGRNTGQECEVRDVDFDTGEVVLWANSAFAPELGDTFLLIPGCDLGFDGGCAAYDNKDRHGGYPHVPGTDSVRQSPEEKA